MGNRHYLDQAVAHSASLWERDRRPLLITLVVLFFVWPFRLLKMKSFWIVAIAVFYIFRVSLLSGPVTYVLTHYLDRYAGIKLTIGEFGGTIFSNVYLRGIQLEEEVGSVRQLQVEEIAISYNVLSPVFGGRIWREISITAPKISLVPREPGEQAHPMRFGKVDFGILLGHGPDIHITGAGFSYESAGRRFSVANFNWHSTPARGMVSVDEVAMGGHTPIGPLSAEWEFAGRILTIEKVSASLGDSPAESLVIERALAVDLTSAGVSAVKIDSPLPGGRVVGLADLKDDFHLHIEELEIDLAKTAQLVVGTSREIKPFPGVLQLRAEILCPRWDISALRGHLLVAVRETPGFPRDLLTPAFLPGSGLLAEIEIDLTAVQHFLRSLGKRVPDISGTVLVEAMSAPYGTGISCEGKIEGGKVRLKGREMPLSGRWEFHYVDERARLDRLVLEFGQSRLRCSADASLAEEVNLVAELDLPSLASFTPEAPDMPEASVAASLNLKARFPDAISGRFTLKAKGATFHRENLGDFHAEGEWTVAGRSWEVLSCRLTQEDCASLRLSAKGGLDPGDGWSAEGQLKLKDLDQLRARALSLFPQLRGKSGLAKSALSGELGIDFSLAGKMPAALTLPDLQGEVEIVGPGLSVAGIFFKDFYSCVDFGLSSQSLTLNRLAVRVGEALSLNIGGKLGWGHEAVSDLTCILAIPDLQSLKPYLSEPPSGAMEATMRVHGDLFARQKTLPVMEGNVLLNNACYRKFRPGPVRLEILGKVGPDEIELDHLSLRGTQLEVMAQGRVSLHHESKVLARLTVSPGKWLPKKMRPWAAGTVTGEISLASTPAKKSGRIETIRTGCNLHWKGCPKIPYRDIGLEAKASLGKNRLRLRQMRLMLEGEEVLRGRCEFDRRQGTATGEVEIELARAGEHVLKWYPGLQSFGLNGQLRARGTFAVVLASGVPQGKGKVTLNLNDLRLGRFSCRELAMKGRWSLEKELELRDFSCSWDGRKIWEAAATVGLARGTLSTIHCRCRIDRIERYLVFIGIAPEVLTGKLCADLSAQGDLWERTWHSALKVNLNEGAVWGRPYREISWDNQLSGDTEHIELNRVVLHWDGAELAAISGAFDFCGNVDVTAALCAPGMERYLGPRIPVRGDMRAHAHLQGTPAAIDSRAYLTWEAALTNVRVFTVELKRVEFLGKVQLTGNALIVEKNSISCDGAAILDMSGQFGYRGGKPTALDIEADLGQVMAIIAPLFSLRDILEGTCRLKAKLSGECSLDTKKLDLTGLASIVFRPRNSGDFWEFRPGPVILWGQETWRGAPNGMTLRLNVQGTTEKPLVSGELSLIQDTIEDVSQNITVQNLRLEVAITDTALTLTGEANVGGGTLKWRTDISHRDYFPEKIEFSMSGDRVLLVRTDDLYGRADLDLTLLGEVSEKDGLPFCKARFSGTITVTEFLVSSSMSLESPPERVFIYPGLESNFIDLDLDLKIELVKVAVRNNLANIETKGEVWIRGKASLPEIGGWVSTNYGKLFLPQGMMDITECMIRLKPENFLVPEINVKAETQVRNYRIMVTIHGPPTALVIEFNSSPSLPQEDIVALLITGGTRTELLESGREKLQETGSFIVMQQILNAVGIGSYVSAQVTSESGTVTISPPSWKGIALQARIDKEGKVRVNVMYRFSFK